MLGKLYEAVNRAYYPGRIHAANPCDLGTARYLRPFGRALRHLGSECGCCAGARVLAVGVLAFVVPELVAAVVVLAYGAALIKELFWPTPDFQAPYDAYDEGSKELDKQS